MKKRTLLMVGLAVLLAQPAKANYFNQGVHEHLGKRCSALLEMYMANMNSLYENIEKFSPKQEDIDLTGGFLNYKYKDSWKGVGFTPEQTQEAMYNYTKPGLYARAKYSENCDTEFLEQVETKLGFKAEREGDLKMAGVLFHFIISEMTQDVYSEMTGAEDYYFDHL